MAVAVQVVIVEGSGTDFRPANAAVAVNDQCTSCFTFAYAQQYVLSPHHDVHLSDSTRHQLDDIRRKMATVAASQEPATS